MYKKTYAVKELYTDKMTSVREKFRLQNLSPYNDNKGKGIPYGFNKPIKTHPIVT